MSRVFIMGDAHGSNERIYMYSNQYKMTKEDIVIICGDFGFVWDGGYKKDLYKLSRACPATILFIDGNHENFDLLEKFPIVEIYGGKAHKLTDQIYHLMRGEIFNINGRNYFAFGGAMSVDKAWRIPRKSWWSQEIPTEEEITCGENNFYKHFNEINYVITHDCPHYIYKHISELSHHTPSIELDYTLRNTFHKWFEDLYYDSANFKKWYCGHHHMDISFDELKFQILYRDIEIIE